MRPMRKIERQTDEQEAFEILERCEYGILSTISPDGQPYGVPLSHAVSEDRTCIYFHCAQEGHKLDNIGNNSKVSFTAVGETKVLSEKFSTDFESAIVFGSVTMLDGEDKIAALRALIRRFSPDFIEEGEAYIQRAASVTTTFKLTIEGISGKRRTKKQAL